MDTRTGQIYDASEVAQMDWVDRNYTKIMDVYPTPIQRAERIVRRNDPCPCGSGKKFKKCCLGKTVRA